LWWFGVGVANGRLAGIFPGRITIGAWMEGQGNPGRMWVYGKSCPGFHFIQATGGVGGGWF